MAQHDFRKLQTPFTGLVDISFSFHSGAAEDASFPGDGYVDGYGSYEHYTSPDVDTTNAAVLPSYGVGPAVYGVLREGVGLYKIMLRKVYVALYNFSWGLETETSKALFVQLSSPGMETETGTDGVRRSVLHVRVTNTSGAETDLEYQDRVHVSLKLKTTRVP